MPGDKRLIGIGTGVLDIDNTGSYHLYEGKSLTDAGNPGVSLIVIGICHKKTVAVLTWGKSVVDLFRIAYLFKYLTGYIGREICFDKFLEGVNRINFSADFVRNSVSAFQAVLDQGKDLRSSS